jgi:hypothetical protein
MFKRGDGPGEDGQQTYPDQGSLRKTRSDQTQPSLTVELRYSEGKTPYWRRNAAEKCDGYL